MKHVHCGDSNSTNLQLNGAGSVNWPHLLAGRMGINGIVNYAAAGASAIDQADPAFACAPLAADRHFYCLGTNDQASYGTDANKRACFALFARAGIAALLSAKSVCGGSGWTLSAGWSANAPYTPGKVSNTAGATASVSFAGDELLIWYVVQPNSGSPGFNVAVDGGGAVFVATNPPADPTSASGKGYGIALKRLVGFGSGSHTVLFTVSAGPVYLAGIGAGRVCFTTGGVYALEIPRNGGTTPGSDANVAAYNQVLADACTELGASFVLAGSFVQVDSLNGGPHYDNNGHHAMADAAARALAA